MSKILFLSYCTRQMHLRADACRIETPRGAPSTSFTTQRLPVEWFSADSHVNLRETTRCKERRLSVRRILTIFRPGHDDLKCGYTTEYGHKPRNCLAKSRDPDIAWRHFPGYTTRYNPSRTLSVIFRAGNALLHVMLVETRDLVGNTARNLQFNPSSATEISFNLPIYMLHAQAIMTIEAARSKIF